MQQRLNNNASFANLLALVEGIKIKNMPIHSKVHFTMDWALRGLLSERGGRLHCLPTGWQKALLIIKHFI